MYSKELMGIKIKRYQISVALKGLSTFLKVAVTLFQLRGNRTLALYQIIISEMPFLIQYDYIHDV